MIYRGWTPLNLRIVHLFMMTGREGEEDPWSATGTIFRSGRGAATVSQETCHPCRAKSPPWDVVPLPARRLSWLKNCFCVPVSGALRCSDRMHAAALRVKPRENRNALMSSPCPGTTFVLGGARSGKSHFAETLATGSGLACHYLATGRAWDAEMTDRIAKHRADRGDGWTTHEEPLDLVGLLNAIDGADRAILVDCLTLWVTNLMMEERDIAAEFAALAHFLPKAQARLILVSNEVGLGIVPENRMARDFRDHAGRLHQMIAARATDVYFVAAGLPLKMKG